MEKNKNLVLSFDTSNYTSSIGIIDWTYNIVEDRRKILDVAKGQRGLKQSHALFQHYENLQIFIKDIFKKLSPHSIAAISVSHRPRPIEGSYMPVFSAGINVGEILAATLGIPIYKFSHQEGHLAASSHGRNIDLSKEFLAFHLSGGTTELLHIKNKTINLLGKTKDISFGQLIDRVGVKMDLSFPAGQKMDEIAQNSNFSTDFQLKPIYFEGFDINLSGLETQTMRWVDRENPKIEVLAKELFKTISKALIYWSEIAVKKTRCKNILFSGGVASSTSIRNIIKNHFDDSENNIIFGSPHLSTDNAVGIGLLGARKIWQ